MAVINPRGRGAVLLGLSILLAAVLALAAWSPQVLPNLMHMGYLRALGGDEAALQQAGSLTTPAAGAGSSALSCQIDLALGRTERAAQTCAGLSPDLLRDVVHTVDVLQQTEGLERTLLAYQTLSGLYPNSALIFYRLSQHQPPGQPVTVDSLRRALALSQQSTDLTTWELVELHLQLAQNYLWWEAPAAALQEATASVELVRNDRGYRMQALAYAHLGQFDQAHASLQAAEALESSYWLHLDRGEVNRLQGNFDAAAADYTAFLAQAGDADRIYGLLKLCNLYLDTQNSAAVEPCRQVAASNDADAGYQILLGNAYVLAGDPASAGEQYRHALEIDPQNVDALERLQTLGTMQ